MSLSSFLRTLGQETGINCSVGRVRGLVNRFIDSVVFEERQAIAAGYGTTVEEVAAAADRGRG